MDRKKVFEDAVAFYTERLRARVLITLSDLSFEVLSLRDELKAGVSGEREREIAARMTAILDEIKRLAPTIGVTSLPGVPAEVFD